MCSSCSTGPFGGIRMCNVLGLAHVHKWYMHNEKSSRSHTCACIFGRICTSLPMNCRLSKQASSGASCTKCRCEFVRFICVHKLRRSDLTLFIYRQHKNKIIQGRCCTHYECTEISICRLCDFNNACASYLNLRNKAGLFSTWNGTWGIINGSGF